MTDTDTKLLQAQQYIAVLHAKRNRQRHYTAGLVRRVTHLNKRISELQASLDAANAEVDRCHARLEIDHHYVVADDGSFVRQDIPKDQRDHTIDGIFCRDAAIAGLTSNIEDLEVQLASWKAS